MIPRNQIHNDCHKTLVLPGFQAFGVFSICAPFQMGVLTGPFGDPDVERLLLGLLLVGATKEAPQCRTDKQ